MRNSLTGSSAQRRAYGLIAQDVEQVLPELVVTNDDGFKAVDYSELPLLTIQAVKDLKVQNDGLKQRIAELEKSDPQALKQRIAELERLVSELLAASLADDATLSTPLRVRGQGRIDLALRREVLRFSGLLHRDRSARKMQRQPLGCSTGRSDWRRQVVEPQRLRPLDLSRQPAQFRLQV